MSWPSSPGDPGRRLSATDLPRRLAERIGRLGPLPFDAWMEAALYDPEGGFFTRGGGAGRAGGDFITSPEVGPLFGTLIGRALDRFWDTLGRPDPFVVVDAGAGSGRLAADVLRARPRCAPALRYVLVERSPALRRAQAEHLPVEPPAQVLGPSAPGHPDEPPEPVAATGPVVTALGEFPAGSFTGVVIANELVDNLPVRLVERDATGGWQEVRVGVGPPPGPEVAAHRARFAEVLVPADPALAAAATALAGDAPAAPGDRLPVATALESWLTGVSSLLRRGFVVVVDYADEVAGLLRRGPEAWLRTYRHHQRGGPALDDPGGQDITADVALPALRRTAARFGFAVVEEASQADWLAGLGMADLVAEARAAWHGRSRTDLAAIAARSRVHEAEALADPSGLGAHRVVVLGRSSP